MSNHLRRGAGESDAMIEKYRMAILYTLAINEAFGEGEVTEDEAVRAIRDEESAKAALRTRLEEAEARAAESEQSEQEMRGVVETYGRVQASQLPDLDVLELRWQVSRAVFRAGGFEVFYAAIKDARQHFADWRKKNPLSTPSKEQDHE